MDPLSALGLASNIISFIDFASNLVKDAAKVYQSASGLPAEVHDAAVVTESLESYMARLSTATLKPGVSVNDKALASLVQDCQKTCVELQQLVRKIKNKAPGSRTESFRVAWRALLRKGKLEELEKRLDKIQSQILSQLVFMLRDEHSETHSKITLLTALEDDRASEIQHIKQEILTMVQSGMRQTQAAVSNNALEHTTVLCEIQDAISKMSTAMKFASGEKQILEMLWFPELESRYVSIEKAHGGTYRWLLHDPDSHSEHGSDDDSISDLSTSSGTTEEIQDQGAEDSVSISSRPGVFQANESHARLEESETSTTGVRSKPMQGDVPASAGVTDLSTRTSVDSDQLSAKTNTSIKRERVQQQVWREQFLNWLQHDNGLFYISGKPGSGKSTLMKSICQDPHSQKLLRIWAKKDGKDLLFVHFFFWNSGSKLQKSLEGLYRGMIWEVLRKRPDLTGQLFPILSRKAYEGEIHPSDINPATLETALRNLVSNQQLLGKNKVCFFIDGLDEYEGDHWKVAKQLKHWCSEPNVKLCVSSRPYNEFVKVFAPTTGSWLKLHELTRGDIQRVVRDELSGDERFFEVRQLGENYNDFIASIVDGADGVFIWVVLVIRSLLTGIGNSCSLAQLRTRLHTVPREINSMFRYMLAEIELPERQAAARVFLTLRNNNDLLHNPSSYLFVQAILDRLVDEPEYEKDILDGKLGPYIKPEECSAQCISMCHRITGRCRGLLQVNASGRAPPSCHTLQLVHRTLYDFLGEKEVMDELHELAGNFPLGRSLALGLLAIVKYLPGDNRITCPTPTESEQSGIENAFPPTFYVIPLIQLAATEEYTGSRPLIAEMEAMKQMLMAHQFTDRNFTFTANHAIAWSWPATTDEKLEFAILCYSVFYGAQELAVERIRRQTLDARQKSALLLLSTWTEMGRKKVPAPTYNGHRTTRHLLEQKVAPNYETGYAVFCGRHRDGETDVPYFPTPPWTPWTLFLLRLAQRMAEDGEDPDPIWKERLRLYLEHGADPSVCFVGYRLPAWKVDSPRNDSPGLDGSSHQNPSNTQESRTGPIYADLRTMLELWDPSEDFLTSTVSSGWLRLPSWLGVFGSNKSAEQIGLEKVGARDIKRTKFLVLKVAPLRKLKDIQISDLDRSLRDTQKQVEAKEPLPLQSSFTIVLSDLA